MIQDIGGRTFHNQYEPRPVGVDDLTLAYRDGKVVASVSGGVLELPRASQWEGLDDELCTYAFRVDEERYYLMEDHALPLPAGFELVGVRDVRAMEPGWRAYACAVGRQLSLWYADNRFCGRCGTRTERAPWTREIVCPECGRVIYPKIQPAVICGVVDGDRLLMTRYAHRKVNHLSLVAGFNEVGETLEETCHREVMEEVGVHIRDLRYYKDQPWPFSSSILAGFFCRLDGDPTIRLDHKELGLGEWLSREDVPDMPEHPVSLTEEMVGFFKRHPEAF